MSMPMTLGRMRKSPLSTKEEAEAPAGEQASWGRVVRPPRALAGPSREPRPAQGPRRRQLVFNFHLLQTSLPGISLGLKC